MCPIHYVFNILQYLMLKPKYVFPGTKIDRIISIVTKLDGDFTDYDNFG